MTINRWRAGDPLRAPRLNETVDELNRIVGLLPPRLRGDAEGPKKPLDDEAEDEESDVEAETDDDIADDAAVEVAVDETWVFVSATSSTTRIEDPDDSDTYVDVVKTTALIFEQPDGKRIKLQLESP